MSRNQALASAAAVLLCLSGVAALFGERPYARHSPDRARPLSAADVDTLRQYNERQQYSLRQQHYERRQRQQYEQGMRLITERKRAARPTRTRGSGPSRRPPPPAGSAGRARGQE